MLSTDLKDFGQHLKRHAAAYGMALIMGALMLAPYAYFTFSQNYRGIAMMGQDAEEHYLARIQEAYDGYPSLGSVFLPYKDTPYLLPGLGENFVAGLGHILGMAAPQVNLFSKFVFPFFVFLLLYGFALEVSRSRASALLGATVAMLGTVLMSNPHEILALLQGSSVTAGITWSRPINPEVSGLLLFGALWLIYRAYRTRVLGLWQMLAIGTLTGMALYVSVYVWSFLGVLILILFCYTLWQRDYQLAKRFFVTGSVALLYAIPFAINFLQAKAHASYTATTLAQGVLTSHAPVLGLWIGVLLLMPILLWPKALAESRTFFVICAVTLLVVLNQQVLTGFYLQPGHYHWYITKPLVGIVLGLCVALWAKHFYGTRMQLLVCAVGILMLLAHGALAQKVFYLKNLPEANAVQAYAPLFNYLNEHSSEVIYTNPLLSIYVPIYTGSDAPGNGYAIFYFVPEDYFAKLQALQSKPTAEAMRELGITMAIKDLPADTWNDTTSSLTKVTTIDNRFEIYRLR